ncbi:MAG: ISAzo13-like element transposase-related protein [Armatimonadota bacterium]
MRRTTTRTGLRIKALLLDKRDYDPGIKISDHEMARLRITAHTTHPRWNYTITPRSGGSA